MVQRDIVRLLDWRNSAGPSSSFGAGCPFAVSFVVTHPASLEDAPEMYKKFRDKKDGVIKVVLRPAARANGHQPSSAKV